MTLFKVFPILGVLRFIGHPKRDGSSIIMHFEACQRSVCRIGSTIAIVNHTRCPAHGVGAGRWSVYASVSNDYTHRRIVGQSFSIVGILVACQPTVHRLPEKAHQSVLHVTTAPTLLQTLLRRLRQSQCIVQLASGQQPSVRGDGCAAKLQPYTSVETELGAGAGASPIGCLQDRYVIKN